jgi:hypothetical protein
MFEEMAAPLNFHLFLLTLLQEEHYQMTLNEGASDLKSQAAI